MGNMLALQYDLVKQSREVLLQYCATLAAQDFCAENSSFGRGSIRNLLVHIANTYEFWLGKQALQKDVIFTAYESVESVGEARQLFQNIDALVAEFMARFSQDYLVELNVSINNTSTQASPLKLFTHVITHEYHHKGQILSLSRHLGYTPVDTDVMR
jgi:uncharacterized damage-inducible protein DinB